MSTIDTSIQEYKRQNTKLIQDIEKKIASIDFHDNAINAAKYIQLTLYKLSAQVGLFIFLKQNEITILSRDFDETVKEFEKLVTFQMKFVKHNDIHILHTEWKDNFSFWQEVDRKLLYTFVIKEHYLITMLHKFLFVNDIRWRIPITNLYGNITISARNFNDIEIFLHNDPSHYVDFDVVKKTTELTYQLYNNTAQVCIEMQGYDKNNLQWYNKALQFLYGSRFILKILKNENEILAINSRIETLQKRMKSENKHTK